MAFCPQCTYEYTRGVMVCPDCGATLVEQLPDPPDHDAPGPSLVALPSLPGRIYAEMVKEVLDARGIPSVIQERALPPGYAPRGTSAESVVLLVPEGQAAESRELQEGMFGDL